MKHARPTKGDVRESQVSRTRRAFTLLEVLITIALMLGLVSALFGFGFDMLSSRQQALQFAWKQRAAATLIERLELDLTSCVAALRSEAGLRGDETSMSLLTRGVAASLAERSADDADVFGDLQRAEYRFDSANGQIQVRRTPWGSTLLGDPAFASMGGRIQRLRFRYHDGSQWQTSFDSLAAGHLPVAVETAIWFSAADSNVNPGASTSTATGPSGNFDESAAAQKSDQDEFQTIPPDRIRVILIPDAMPAPASATRVTIHPFDPGQKGAS